MSRRQPTEAQKAAAADRRERFKAMCARVAEMSDDDRAAIVDRVGAVVTCEGHALSRGNTVLVRMQLPTASVVGGFAQWLKIGRCVRKGEHGQMIWIPSTKRTADSTDTPVTEAIGETEGGGAPRRRSYIVGTVFDISQTDAKQ